jgi:two-component system, OmpR family, alkaline phosphatase synthesis response regulator PhoP
MKVLIVEDDANIRRGLEKILLAEGYAVIGAADGTQGLALFRREAPDFVCLDIMMPGVNGYDLCRTMRNENPNTPVIFISAKAEEVDKVLGLELGADDFIVKPFGVREVVARIRAVTRRCMSARTPQPAETRFTMGDLEVLPAELRARREGRSIDLSLRDIKILRLLHDRRGQVVDRHTFFQTCWGIDHIPNSRTLDQHISQLRQRIEIDPKSPTIIRTVYGVGYRYEPGPEAQHPATGDKSD